MSHAKNAIYNDVALVSEYDVAEEVYRALQERGYLPDELYVVYTRSPSSRSAVRYNGADDHEIVDLSWYCPRSPRFQARGAQD